MRGIPTLKYIIRRPLRPNRLFRPKYLLTTSQISNLVTSVISSLGLLFPAIVYSADGI